MTSPGRTPAFSAGLPAPHAAHAHAGPLALTELGHDAEERPVAAGAARRPGGAATRA